MPKRQAALVLGLVALLGGCAHFAPPKFVLRPEKSPDEILKKTDNPLTVSGRFVAAYTTAVADANDTANPTKDAADAWVMTQAGMTLLDSRCTMFFNYIGRGSQDLDFTNRELQTVDGIVIAALGIANASNAAIAGVGLGGNLLTKSLGNFGDVFFFSPDVASVQKLVDTAHLSARNILNTTAGRPSNFYGAIDFLRSYQNICTAHQIKDMVTQSVNISTANAKPNTPSVNATDEATIALAAVTAQSIGANTISLNELALLSWVGVATGAPSADQSKAICTLLNSSLQQKVCTGGIPDTTLAAWTTINANLKTINIFNPGAMAKLLSALQTTLASQQGPLLQALAATTVKAAPAASIQSATTALASLISTIMASGPTTTGSVGGFTVSVGAAGS